MDGLYNDLAHAKVFPDHLFGDQDEYSIGVDAGRYDSKLRHFVEVIIHKAAEAQLDNANEGGWSAIVERVLESPIENPLFKVCNVSTYNIEQSLIPVNRDDIPVKRSRVDYILGFNTSDASVDKVVAMYPDTSISVFKHIHHRAAAASFIGIEIKTLQGNYTDGLYQSTIHSTAVVTLWSRLREQAAAAETRESRKRASKKRATKKRNVHEPLGDFPPVPSIVVIGHQWNLHWTFLENDEQVIVGPIDMGSTMNILGTLKLLANVRKLKHWAEHGIGANDTGVWTKLAGWVEASNTG
ncbi:hypothetical protein DFH27DRAFT_550296 [Peziza echinospora]|nr:hypothetical protein DFH27DRAFT_550296 [Peziza echinospora]